MDRRKGKVLLHCLMVLMVIHVKRASFRERGVCVCVSYYMQPAVCPVVWREVMQEKKSPEQDS